MKKRQLLADNQTLADTNAKLARENAELHATVIRVSVPTGMGLRPIYQAELDIAIMMTNLRGGNGMDIPVEGITIEVISQWKPNIRDNDDS